METPGLGDRVAEAPAQHGPPSVYTFNTDTSCDNALTSTDFGQDTCDSLRKLCGPYFASCDFAEGFVTSMYLRYGEAVNNVAHTNLRHVEVESCCSYG